MKGYLGIGTEEKVEAILPSAELEPSKQEEVPVVKGASFFFSSEDEEEIRELTKKFNGSMKKDSSGEGVEEKLNGILSSAQINFGSHELQDRFRSILKVYLLGILGSILHN